MATISWALYTEQAVGRGHPTLTDVINRPLRSVLTVSGADPDADFAGFALKSHTQLAATISDLATAATGITSVGTIGTGTWQGTPVAAAYLGAHTHPFSAITATPTTAAGYGITAVGWSLVTGTPVTLAGYGIADAYTKAAVDASLAALSASNLTTGTIPAARLPAVLAALHMTAPVVDSGGLTVTLGTTALQAVTATALTLTATPLAPASGGSGVNNGTFTTTLSGNLVTAGGYALVLTTTAATNVTLPTTGTLVSSGAAVFTGGVTFSGVAGTSRYVLTDETATGTGVLAFQGGAGSAGFGGSLSLYAASHASKPGYVEVGLGSLSARKFQVTGTALGTGATLFSVDQIGAVIALSTITTTGVVAVAASAQSSTFSSAATTATQLLFQIGAVPKGGIGADWGGAITSGSTNGDLVVAPGAGCGLVFGTAGGAAVAGRFAPAGLLTLNAGLTVATGMTTVQALTATGATSLQSASLAGNLTFTGVVGTNRYLITDETATGTGVLVVQAGSGSGAMGGALSLYAGAHATKPGYVEVGLGSSASTRKFQITSLALGGGAVVFSVDQAGTVAAVGGFGCNGATAQASAASGGAVATTAATNVSPYGFATAAQADGVRVLVNAIRAALVANGIMS